VGGIKRKIGRVLLYRVIAPPIAWLFMKIRFGHIIVGKEKLTGIKGGYFIYGNHTNPVADALIPTLVSFPKGMYVIVHADNVSMPVLGKLTPCLGALPLPEDGKAVRNFNSALGRRIQEKQGVTIYPEAHIWPYYTKIRPFTEASFRYPVSENVPVYCFTNTYQERRFFKSPRMVTYVDGPFFASREEAKPVQKKELRNQVYETMVERSKNNTVEMVKYVKRDTKGED
jgi:1-acyl-sn-glycerol-3-phosphate acyltransferase